jgi:hypothetical protein
MIQGLHIQAKYHISLINYFFKTKLQQIYYFISHLSFSLFKYIYIYIYIISKCSAYNSFKVYYYVFIFHIYIVLKLKNKYSFLKSSLKL